MKPVNLAAQLAAAETELSASGLCSLHSVFGDVAHMFPLLFHPHVEKGGAILTKVKSDDPAVASQAWPAYHSPVATDDDEVSFFLPAPIADKGR